MFIQKPNPDEPDPNRKNFNLAQRRRDAKDKKIKNSASRRLCGKIFLLSVQGINSLGTKNIWLVFLCLVGLAACRSTPDSACSEVTYTQNEGCTISSETEPNHPVEGEESLAEGIAIAGPDLSVEPGETLTKEMVIDLVWAALMPNTTSKSRSNWQVVTARQAQGAEVADQFEGEPAPGCWQGPPPPNNETINPTESYWFIYMQPKPATPAPDVSKSPTAPPAIPEPFLREAYFLVDMDTGQIIARSLHCIIY